MPPRRTLRLVCQLLAGRGTSQRWKKVNGLTFDFVASFVWLCPAWSLPELGIDTPAAQQVFMLAFTAAGRVSGSEYDLFCSLSHSIPIEPLTGQQHAPLSQTSLPPPSTPISASQLLALPTTLPAHSFQSQAISALIQPAGGVQRGTIVEVSGPPGIGKTAAVVGLSLDARRSEEEVLVIGEYVHETKRMLNPDKLLSQTRKEA